MHIAARRRCRNIIERRAKGRNFSKRCEINFLPTVHLDTDKNEVKTNHLECLTSLHGFKKCPTLRSPGATAKLLCDSEQHASHTCSSAYESVRTSCRVMEICDQAVVLSGGWNRLTTGVSYVDNIMSMYHLLRRNRFKRRNIKIFFANGINDFQVPNESPLTVHSAAMKLGFRQHVHHLCASPHCVDSLVIYLNSPALKDGSMLLWDVNQNGIAEDWEKYTVDELVADLAGCSARQIVLLVDQSYSGEIAKVLKESAQHNNMMVLTNGKEHEYSYTSEFSHFWSKQNDTRSCVTDLFKESSVMTEHSTPVMVNPGNIRTTLSGAPCDVRPRFSNRELRREYFGCQNLPTAVWVQGNL
ncbi:unnamed protein product [Lymnaea stagnalis]|uniref:Uncharacterized protein n=1 Tax=Lymnaea stagnalis TaxID=6523 RepID=A0AAV2H3F6_LYMST